MLQTKGTIASLDSMLMTLDTEYNYIDQYVESLSYETSAPVDELMAIEEVQKKLLSIIMDLKVTKTELRLFEMNSKNLKWK